MLYGAFATSHGERCKTVVCALLLQVALAGHQICPSANFAGIFSGYFGVPSLDHQSFLPEDSKVCYCATAAGT